MKKEIKKFDIFEIKHFNGLLDDFQSIFEDKNLELDLILVNNTLESVKKDRVNTLMFVVLSYNDALNNIKERFVAFKKSTNVEKLNKNSFELVKEFGKKINKYLSKCKNFISKCEVFLNSDEKTTDLM